MKKVSKRLVPILAAFLIFFSLQGEEKTAATIRQAIPGGSAIGLKLYLDGLLVVGESNIKSGTKNVCPGKDAGIEKGDRITKINGKPISNTLQFCEEIQNSCGREITVHVVRGEKNFDKKLQPVLYDETGEYKIGLWVRDSTAGIGTLTFVLSDGTFGALGHGISDVDTKELIVLKEGTVSGSKISSVMKGISGAPGDLRGSFEKGFSGTVSQNTSKGIYGVLSESNISGETMEIASREDVTAGKATIYSNVQGNIVEKFDIEIERINPFGSDNGKNMVIRVTDPDLIEKTGGIVQGMSGSPVIQNGKLVGAVTHVFVNDPTRGYGIFIENMLAEAEKIK